MADEKTSEEKPRLDINIDMKLILIGLLVFLVVVGGSFFLMKSLMAPLMPKEEGQSKLMTGNLVEVGEFTTNINDVNGQRFLRVKVTVEVTSDDKKAQEKIIQYMPVIKDSILSIISSKTVADLDVRNRNNLKVEIKNDLNAKIGANTVMNVYFTDFIMQ
ncbi:MAG: flagellar basal body-associated FliL family protein [Syntrophomonas sp.]|uniref:flagellar basal body-associated FliL family protein n=1 Tax=Syntrophomonas sp. TaxID=2053627 RepID=UPI00261249BE|nr:flagellar basal body-associated FliL family protein [Syntrophomonas sp.]MDD2511175.1 flagellar basal body-associated FliL family protein [Syntrophomonas sp.]MDD3879741.1 flagellar basal body-associated FliL family protein [Syntrophomonas sp.]MDD4627351.1 flagellar basal body-associated FliL family protein [Syntrophomonas sp.]